MPEGADTFIEKNDDEAIYGLIATYGPNLRNRSAEFGYTVNPSSRGLGIGGKMLKHCINKIFSTTDLNKLYGQTGSFNTPSVKMLKKAEFHRDAILREHHELDGRFYADYIYSILRSEWLASDYFNN